MWAVCQAICLHICLIASQQTSGFDDAASYCIFPFQSIVKMYMPTKPCISSENPSCLWETQTKHRIFPLLVHLRCCEKCSICQGSCIHIRGFIVISCTLCNEIPALHTGSALVLTARMHRRLKGNLLPCYNALMQFHADISTLVRRFSKVARYKHSDGHVGWGQAPQAQSLAVSPCE